MQNLATVYYLTGDVASARKYFQAALDAPDYHLLKSARHAQVTYLDYAQLRVRYDSPTAARDFISQALKEYPESWELWFLLALANGRANDIPAAIDAAAKAHQLVPTSAQVTALYNSLENDAQKHAADLVYHNGLFKLKRGLVPFMLLISAVG